MDPLTIGAAFVTAQTAVKGIKEAIKLGKEIGDIAHDVNKFFHSQATIDKAARQKTVEIREAVKDPNKKQTYYELTAHAMDIAIKQEEMARYEKEIRDTLIWSGNGHIYRKMCIERNRMIQEQEQAEAAQKIVELRQKQLDDARKEEVRDMILVFVIFIVFAGLFWWTVEWMIAKGMVLPFAGLPGRR